MKKYILALGLVLSFNVNASNDCGDDLNNNCWDCGKTEADNCTARLDGTKLTIISTNNGQMKDYDYYDEQRKAPWGNKATSADIQGIKNIGAFAFKHASALTEVNISDSVKTLGYASFDESGLKSITLHDKLEVIGDYAFSSRSMSAQEIIIPDTVTTIGSYVFQSNKGLKSIIIGDNVTSIGRGAFDFVDNEMVIYCEDNEIRLCKSLISQNNSEDLLRLKACTTKKINGVKYIYDANGELLARSGQRTEKRIYTIDEANAVAGKTNSVKITYR